MSIPPPSSLETLDFLTLRDGSLLEEEITEMEMPVKIESK